MVIFTSRVITDLQGAFTNGVVMGLEGVLTCRMAIALERVLTGRKVMTLDESAVSGHPIIKNDSMKMKAFPSFSQIRMVVYNKDIGSAHPHEEITHHLKADGERRNDSFIRVSFP